MFVFHHSFINYFISIGIFCFLLTDILLSKVTNVQGVLQQLNADIDTKDDNNMNSIAS